MRLSPSTVGESNIYLQEGEENSDKLDNIDSKLYEIIKQK